MDKLPEDIRQLEEKILRLKEEENERRRPATKNVYAGRSALGLRAAVDLLSAVLVGAAIGYTVDRLADTRPLFLAIFLLFGGAAGVLNVYRLSKDEEIQRQNRE